MCSRGEFEMEKEELYGSMKIEELKKLLKERGAKLSGRKAELVNRLIFYEKNNNFGYEPTQQDDIIKTPLVISYKDINSSSPVPSFTEKHFKISLSRNSIQERKASQMYRNKFLKYIRYSIHDNIYFVKACCKAEMKKYMQYIVDVSFSVDGEIIDSTCDCPIGRSKQAHCKHVLILLLTVIDLYLKQTVILEETCTDKLQTFHRPAKKYNASPLKAVKFVRRVKENSVPSVCEDFDEDYKVWYRNYFRNTIISRGFNCQMAIKQLVEPANMYALEWDHSFYTKNTKVNDLFKSLHLVDISETDVEKIELETRDQSKSEVWKAERSIRITSTFFFSCCNSYLDAKKANSIVTKIMHPISFTSKVTEHGKIYEKTAIQKYNEMHLHSLDIKSCGLFISAERPYLGASPDGLIFEHTVIEVKCPYASRNMKINEITVPYIENDKNGNFILKKHHPYFYQIQGQLYITKRKFCDFVIYTFIDILRISIERDDAFISDMLKKLDYFYETYLKPAIIEKYIYKNYGSVFCK